MRDPLNLMDISGHLEAHWNVIHKKLIRNHQFDELVFETLKCAKNDDFFHARDHTSSSIIEVVN